MYNSQKKQPRSILGWVFIGRGALRLRSVSGAGEAGEAGGAGGGESRFDDKKLDNLFFGVPGGLTLCHTSNR
jgi:hypothetical protein